MKIMNTTEHGQRRRGMTIAEVMIAATGVSVLSVMGMTVVCLLMTTEQRAMESIVVERTIGELADELRFDAHRSHAASLDDTQMTLTLQLEDDITITYTCNAHSVDRSDTTDRKEQYHLPFGQSRFEFSEANRLISWLHAREPVLDMSLSEPAVGTDPPRLTYRIDAALLALDNHTEGRP